jgi:membrane associated rhomboid family serine protease
MSLFDFIQIIVFILLVGLFILPFKFAKTTSQLRYIYIAFLCILIGLLIFVIIEPVGNYNFLIYTGIILSVVGIGKKLKQLKNK